MADLEAKNVFDVDHIGMEISMTIKKIINGNKPPSSRKNLW